MDYEVDLRLEKMKAESNKTVKLWGFSFSVETFKEIIQILNYYYEKSLLTFNHLAPSFMKSLFIIFSMSPKVTSKQCSGAYLSSERSDGCQALFECLALCAAYNCNKSSKNNPEKTLFTIPKNKHTRKAWIAVLNQEEGTSVQSQQHINI